MTNKTDKPSDLTGKQQAFVAAYLSNGFNATKAAVEAGYAPDSAHVEGSRLLRNAKVQAAIASAFQEKGVAPETIQILLSSIAFDADIADFEPWINGEKTLDQLRAEGVDTRAVKSATVNPRTESRKIELHDRLASLKELGRILGLVTSKHEHGLTVNIPRLKDTREWLAEQAEIARVEQSERRIYELVNEGRPKQLSSDSPTPPQSQPEG